jgi:hypothetical protein
VILDVAGVLQECCNGAAATRQGDGKEAEVGIGQFTPLLHAKYARIHWQFNINRLNPTIPVLTLLMSVLVSVSTSCVVSPQMEFQI